MHKFTLTDHRSQMIRLFRDVDEGVVLASTSSSSSPSLLSPVHKFEISLALNASTASFLP